VHAKQHIVSVEIGSVMECHALAKLELPSGVVERFPGRRQARRQVLFVVLFDQPREEMLRDLVVWSQVVVVWIY